MINTALTEKTCENKDTNKLSAINFARDEMNLAEFPLAVLSTRTNPNIKTLEFHDTVKLKSGEFIKRNWIITGTDKFGLPTSTDDDVILGLICLSRKSDFKERKITFTQYELLKILQWTTEGRSYQRLEKSLDRLSGVKIKTNAFYNNAERTFQVIENFGIIDSYKLVKTNISGATNKYSHFVWSEQMFNSFKANNIKSIDFSLYTSLASAVAKRLYRYLDKHFYYTSTITKPLMMFAFEKLGLSRTYKYISSVKQQLVPACEELIQKGFLKSYEFSDNGEEVLISWTKNSETTVKKLGWIATERDNKSSQPALTPQQFKTSNSEVQFGAVQAKLLERGLNLGQVKGLLAGKSTEEIQRICQIIEYFDKLVLSGSTKAPTNKIGFLYRAVQNVASFKLPGDNLSFKATVQPSIFEKKIEDGTLKRSAYEQYKKRMIFAYRKNLSEADLLEIQIKAEASLKYIKNSLSERGFAEAKEGIVLQELVGRAGVLSFEEWQKVL
ncbi:MAG: replication initiator protein A [Deltaproteobacteria bacterium]|jgi:hypothetical protein|nr:replication initiator protein A [Deltaproteobacteria bacterium]